MSELWLQNVRSKSLEFYAGKGNQNCSRETAHIHWDIPASLAELYRQFPPSSNGSFL